MKKIIGIFLAFALLGVFAWTTYFLYQKSQQAPVVYETTTPFSADIYSKTVATGNIKPRQEIEVKSKVSGVVEKIFVEAGDAVAKGDLIARIELVPDVEYLRTAESNLEKARLNFMNTSRDFERQKKLFANSLISEFEYNKFELQYDLAKEVLAATEDNVALIKEGVTNSGGRVSNLVYATADGILLTVPVKQGTFVIESNTFNAGTTIAQIANMEDMIFEGQIDESEVGKLEVGMPLTLSIGALNERSFAAELEFIAPKGTDQQGTIKFEIRAAIELQDDIFLRAGYSANAEIVLDQRNQVLAINEGNLLIEADGTYVEVATGEQTFVKRQVVTGLSDGINVEIVSGLDASARIKKQN
ncbi:MAG TPA: efflux RND transporter periplasmic adaptor subunit [Marinagarivorans sp.]